jgi:hypothetical protein
MAPNISMNQCNTLHDMSMNKHNTNPNVSLGMEDLRSWSLVDTQSHEGKVAEHKVMRGYIIQW